MPLPRISLLAYWEGGLFLSLAGLFAWLFYTYYISEKSKVSFVDESHGRVYLKDNGTVVGKEIKDGSYNLIFVYPDNGGPYRGAKPVSKNEYDKSQPGDKFLIFYNPADPEEWMLPSGSKMGWGAVALIIPFIICFLIGMASITWTLRAYLRNR